MLSIEYSRYCTQMNVAVRCALYRKRSESVTGVGSSVNKVSDCRDLNLMVIGGCENWYFRPYGLTIFFSLYRLNLRVLQTMNYGRIHFQFSYKFKQISSFSICMNIFHFCRLHMMTYLPFCLHLGRNSPNIFPF